MRPPHRSLRVLLVLLILKAMTGPWALAPLAAPVHATASHHAAMASQGEATACQLRCEAAQMQALPAASYPLAIEANRVVAEGVIARVANRSISPGLRPPIS